MRLSSAGCRFDVAAPSLISPAAILCWDTFAHSALLRGRHLKLFCYNCSVLQGYKFKVELSGTATGEDPVSRHAKTSGQIAENITLLICFGNTQYSARMY